MDAQRDAVANYLNGRDGKLIAEFAEVESGKRNQRQEMEKAIASSRPELSPFAPRMYKISIPQDKIGAVIGPGGKTIRAITS